MISVGRNQNQIFGKIDGVKFPNLPLDAELFKKLNDIAKSANNYEKESNRASYKDEVDNFKSLLPSEEIVKKVEEEKKQVKVGTNKLKIVLLSDKPYLLNQAGHTSRFYIPTNIYKRILDGESKGLDTLHLYKFMVRALRGEKMTQSKLNNLDTYMSREWLDTDKYEELLAKGLSESVARSQATFPQVPITAEGFIHTYKVSTVVSDSNIDIEEYDDEEEEEPVVEAQPTAEIDISEFKFVPVRNSKGHFLKRGSDEYIGEYNKQLETFKASKGITNPVISIGKGDAKKKVPATLKYAENYTFKPYYQGSSGDAFFCGDELGHIIKVGKVHKLPSWDMVNTSDSDSGRPGLHVGGLQYVHDNNQAKINAPTHNIFVDPQFIGAVVNADDNYGAIRVKEYYVHSSFIAPNKGTYNSSTYGAMVDAEWDAQLKTALQTVEEAEAQIALIRKQAEEAQAVLDNSFSV
jgi:hypothetical protein